MLRDSSGTGWILNATRMPYVAQHKVRIQWSSDFAYAIGLLASDGYLNKDRRHIGISSKEREMMLNLRSALCVQNKIRRSARGGEREKRYFQMYFGDTNFYRFLESIGVGPAKSKTIQNVRVPESYVADFLRGLFDGDGSFYTFWDRRWPQSFGYQIAFYSASRPFLERLERKLGVMYRVQGFFVPGDGVCGIRYLKGSTRTLFQRMYHRDDLLYLDRKYRKICAAFEFDAALARERARGRTMARVTAPG